MYKNERDKPKCKLHCECKDTGYVEVQNLGQFKSELKSVVIVCNHRLGDLINAKRPPENRLPVYDPKTMYLVGEPLPKLQQQMF